MKIFQTIRLNVYKNIIAVLYTLSSWYCIVIICFNNTQKKRCDGNEICIIWLFLHVYNIATIYRSKKLQVKKKIYISKDVFWYPQPLFFSYYGRSSPSHDSRWSDLPGTIIHFFSLRRLLKMYSNPAAGRKESKGGSMIQTNKLGELKCKLVAYILRFIVIYGGIKGRGWLLNNNAQIVNFVFR